jgi:MerR family transcriptional regulator, light-induced transcriptional regulator
MSEAGEPGGLRIGELSRRVGVSTDVLRAWERRYGVLAPARTRSGQRMYGSADEARVRLMQARMAAGYSPQVAARMTLAAPAEPAGAVAPGPESAGPDPGLLYERLVAFDEPGAQEEVDRILASYSLDAALREVVLPVLRHIGRAWEEGRISIAQEHFASNLLGGRLRALARGFDRGVGPRALVACVAGEFHDLGALGFALALRARGWRVTWLGADVPAAALGATADELRPDLIVLAAAREEPLAAADLGRLARDHRVALGGAGATPALAGRLGIRLLPNDAVRAADELAVGAER